MAQISQSSTSAFARQRLHSNRQAIALISDYGDPVAEIGSEEADGQNLYVRQVSEALARLGWQVDMFTRKANSEDATIVQHSPYCRTIRLVAGPQQPIARDRLFEYMPDFLAAFQKFQAKEGSNYPLIHTNYWLSGWVGLQLQQQNNIQLVHTYHSLGSVKYQSTRMGPLAKQRLEIERQLLEHANVVVATSPQERETLRQLVSPQGQIEVIPCGTDMIDSAQLISKADARVKIGLPPQEAIVLTVGRFDPRKGIDTLIRAFAVLKDTYRHRSVNGASLALPRLVIVGGDRQADSREREHLESLVRELDLAEHTLFTGQVDHELLPLYYSAADVCVIPSQYEPFGLVAIEAMACGTPVVASDVGGLRFTVMPEETGLLVPPLDVDGFATAIDRVLSDELWARKLRRQASARVQQNFSWSGVAVQLSDLYRRLLAQSLMHEHFWMPQHSAL